jgi:hypothetical protein
MVKHLLNSRRLVTFNHSLFYMNHSHSHGHKKPHWHVDTDNNSRRLFNWM